MNELEQLRELYLQDLTKMVNYDGKNPRPRVRHPMKWAKLNSLIHLNEKYEEPISLVGRKVWVWSDLHFFHNNIINFSDRPYMNAGEMNEHLIANFNDYVGPDDISIWVGDIGLANENRINELIDHCRGYKILILGNHDFHRKKRPLKLNFDETHLIYIHETPEVDLCFTHYPMENIPYPWVNIHGHLHASQPFTGHPLHYNVCCELHNYKPIKLEEIIRVAKIRVISYGD